MKNLYLIFVLFLCLNESTSILQAQQDSISITEEYSEEEVDYLSPLEYAFMMHEKTPWMFKLGFPVGSNTDVPTYISNLPANANANTSLYLGFERKIGDALSLNMAFEVLSLDSYSGYGNFILAPRWYYGMKKRMREKNVGSNLSGNYVSTGIKYQFTDHNRSFLTLFAEWGAQRRFLKRGYLDFGFQAGYIFPAQTNTGGVLTIGPKINVGLAWAKDKQSFDESKLCDIFKCYETKNTIIKINLANALNAAFQKDLKTIRASLDVGIEHKIGKSPFSVTGQAIGFLYNQSNNTQYKSNTYSATGRLGSRYYYNLKRNIATGKSGNGLSANYFSLELVGSTFINKLRINNEFSNTTGEYLASDFMMGFQRTISDHLYYDIRFGVGAYLGNSEYEESVERIRIPFNIGVGIRL